MVSSNQERRRRTSKSRGRYGQKLERKKAAEQQIRQLLDLALRERAENPKLAQRHGELAWRISTRFNVKLGEKRDLFCHYCKRLMFSIEDVRYRFARRKNVLRITCRSCGKTYRRPLK